MQKMPSLVSSKLHRFAKQSFGGNGINTETGDRVLLSRTACVCTAAAFLSLTHGPTSF